MENDYCLFVQFTFCRFQVAPYAKHLLHQLHASPAADHIQVGSFVIQSSEHVTLTPSYLRDRIMERVCSQTVYFYLPPCCLSISPPSGQTFQACFLIFSAMKTV